VVTEELKAKIVKQVEFYFSDTNLPTDNYLMKFVKKIVEGGW
jgi:La-related protein 7